MKYDDSRVHLELTTSHVAHHYRGLEFSKAMRLESGVEEKLRRERTGNKTSTAVRKAEYRAQANRVLAKVYLVFHTYVI